LSTDPAESAAVSTVRTAVAGVSASSVTGVTAAYLQDLYGTGMTLAWHLFTRLYRGKHWVNKLSCIITYAVLDLMSKFQIYM
jgi:hypothetical protein